MLNHKYFPFERNKYYFGKLLTAKDFESEQRYFNDKRRFMNRLINSWGIVCGLGVVAADDASIVIQSGCALDPSGREIVIPETEVIKLSAIDGFSELESSVAYLTLQYDEQPADEVYSVIDNGENQSGTKFNKDKETFKLKLVDEFYVESIESPIESFVSQKTIYSDETFQVIQKTPMFVSQGSNILIKVEIKKIGKANCICSMSYDLKIPGFETTAGENSINIFANNISLKNGESKIVEYTLIPQSYIWSGNSSITVEATNFNFQKDTESFSINNQVQFQIKPVKGDISTYVLTNYYNKSMDKLLSDSYDSKLWLAKINIIKTTGQYIVDSVEPAPFSQYVYNAEQLMLIKRVLEYYPNEKMQGTVINSDNNQIMRESNSQDFTDFSKVTACGVQDISLGLGYELRQPVFSEEIMHGLGIGTVYVNVGIEFITSKNGEAIEMSEVYIGDSSMFNKYDGNQKNDDKLYNVTTAVKILPERGTFVIGVCPYESSDIISVRVRWYAIRLNELNKKLKSHNNGAKCLLINPDTIVIQPKGTAYINPAFINMDAESCSYKLVDIEGGTIDNNGVYTAPSKEGVYEIKVEAISDPSIYTHAFVIVSQKKAKESK